MLLLCRRGNCDDLVAEVTSSDCRFGPVFDHHLDSFVNLWCLFDMLLGIHNDVRTVWFAVLINFSDITSLILHQHIINSMYIIWVVCHTQLSICLPGDMWLWYDHWCFILGAGGRSSDWKSRVRTLILLTAHYWRCALACFLLRIFIFE